jgi:hypothetical protein
MKSIQSLAPLLLVCAVCSLSAADSYLRVAPDTPEIEVRERAGERSLRLPSLTYRFHIEGRCAPPFEPASLLISIADSSEAVTGSLLASALDTGLALTIPAEQLAPVAVENFCVSSAGASRDIATVQGLLSAQAALACSANDEASVLYASSSLDLSLRCRRSEESSAEP